MSDKKPTIIYTETDEAPQLATYSFLPIIKAFADASDVGVELRDISLSGRIVASFPDYLTAEQKMDDALAELGELTQDPMANIIKLPNISASTPQLKAAIKELQAKGYKLPDYPEEPGNDEQRQVKERYDKIRAVPSIRFCARVTRTAALRPRSRTMSASIRTPWVSGLLIQNPTLPA